MAATGCKHKYVEIIIESSDIKTHDLNHYYTYQCKQCGIIPNSDFKRHMLHMNDCMTCLAFVQEAILTAEKYKNDKEKGKAILREMSMRFAGHTRDKHPEVNILPLEEFDKP